MERVPPVDVQITLNVPSLPDTTSIDIATDTAEVWRGMEVLIVIDHYTENCEQILVAMLFTTLII